MDKNELKKLLAGMSIAGLLSGGALSLGPNQAAAAGESA